MKITFRKSLQADFMAVNGPKLTSEDLFQLKMLLTNRIPGLISFGIDPSHDGTDYLYDITSLLPFDEYCRTKNPGAGELLLIYEKILNTVTVLDDYLLDPDHLCLEKNALFMGWGNAGLLLAYIPSYRNDIRDSLLAFSKCLLTADGFGDEDSMILNCRMYHELKKKNSSIEDLRAILRNTGGFREHIRDSAEENPSSGSSLQDSVRKKEPASENAFSSSAFVPLYASSKGAAGESRILKNESSAVPETEDDPDSVLPERDSKKAPRKGRSTFLTLLIAAVPAVLFYVLIHLQNMFVLSFSETLGASLLAAAAVLTVLILIDRFRERKKTRLQDIEFDEEFPE